MPIPDSWKWNPRLLTVRDALGLPLERSPKSEGGFQQPGWSVSVRRRGADEFERLDDIDDWCIENRRFGKIVPAVCATYVDTETGQPLVGWDQYRVEEGPPLDESAPRNELGFEERLEGAVIVPYYLNDDPLTSPSGIQIALIERLRHVVAGPGGTLGSETLFEVPRGFADPTDRASSPDEAAEPTHSRTAIREFQEEVGRSGLRADFRREFGYPVERYRLLGHTIANTAFFSGRIAVYACRVASTAQPEFSEEENKVIDRIEPIFPAGALKRELEVRNLRATHFKTKQFYGTWIDLDDLATLQRDGVIVDCLTQAALYMFLTHQEHLRAPL